MRIRRDAVVSLRRGHQTEPRKPSKRVTLKHPQPKTLEDTLSTLPKQYLNPWKKLYKPCPNTEIIDKHSINPTRIPKPLKTLYKPYPKSVFPQLARALGSAAGAVPGKVFQSLGFLATCGTLKP